jgi:hypothetical protein
VLSIHASNATWFVANQEAGPATILARSNNFVTISNRSAEEAEDAAAGARQEASAALSAAQHLNSDLVDVTLIDRRNYHLFRPLLYQVATGSLSAGEISCWPDNKYIVRACSINLKTKLMRLRGAD